MTAWRKISARRRSHLHNLELLERTGGNVAVIFALVLPVLLVTGLGAVQLNQVVTDKKRTQDVADSAALMGASQLAVTPVGADQRAQAYAQAQLADVASNATVTVSATIGQNDTITVAVDTQRVSFFGNLLPLGGFHTHVTSTAKGVNTAPLCVLGIAPALLDTVHVTGASQLQAGQCLVHSNQSLTADVGASILASANEAGTAAVGPIFQTPDLLAPNIADPFANLNVNANCSSPGVTSGPGVYTSQVTFTANSNTTIPPGEYYFCKGVTISGNSSLTGTNVVFVFANGATINFNGSKSTVSLSGRQSGPLAGFVLIADRTYTGTFTLPSDNITSLTGTIYVPTATLAVNGSAKSGATAPWTVITAKSFTVNGGAQLVINANYSGSSVPVPLGVGNQRQNVKLMQ